MMMWRGWITFSPSFPTSHQLKRLSFIIGALLLAISLAWFWPLPGQLEKDNGPSSTRILDRNGRLLYEIQRGGKLERIPLGRIPLAAQNALIAVEDRSFYSHAGINIRGLARAVITDLKTFSFAEGGSSITQQLVRAKLAPGSRGPLYKLLEMWLALKVDARYSKEEILEQYFNAAYFGSQSYGIAASARTYFDKRPQDLSLAESALLIGLLNAPSSLNPFKNLAGALERRHHVLSAMLETGVISDDQFNHAEAEPVRLMHGRISMEAPHFVQWLIGEREEAIGMQQEIRTTLDLGLQHDVERSVARRLLDLVEKNVSSAAVVVIDARSGDILAMVGSADYFDDAHDGAVNVAISPRQPGSALKPFTYALAFTNGMTPASTVADIESQFFTQEGNPYIPRNYDYSYHGLVRLREALANSYNITAVKVLEKVGVHTLLNFLRSLGLSTLEETPEHYGLALTLGDSEVKLLELARAYAIFPRLGRSLELRTLLSDPETDGAELLDPRAAWLITSILSDPVARAEQFGTDGPLSFEFPVAAKTGTTRNSRDNWTMGYTQDRIVGVWVGNADNTPMRGTSGVTGAGPIFHDVMVAATAGRPHATFLRPDGITERTICKLSGKLPTSLCPSVIQEYFVQGTEPREKDDIFHAVKVDRRNHLLATETCPVSQVTTEVFALFPPELRRWARENGWKEPPDDSSPLCTGSVHSLPEEHVDIVITSPGDGTSFRLDPLIPMAHQNISLEATAPRSLLSLTWYIDGKELGEGMRPDFRLFWRPTVGNHSVQARSKNAQSNIIHITVEKP
jgi:penicillin-binding protein 1C